MNFFLNRAALMGLAACLLLGSLALAGCSPSDARGDANELAEQQQSPIYAVDLPPLDGVALLADLQSDVNFTEWAQLVYDIQLAQDDDAQHIDLTVAVASSDLDELCAAGQAVAQCLSDHAAVTDEGGNQVSDDGPCGALFEAYSLSVRVEGLGSDDVFDGSLPAGGTEIVWQ